MASSALGRAGRAGEEVSATAGGTAPGGAASHRKGEPRALVAGGAALLSFVASLAFLELVVFRYVLPAPDAPEVELAGDVLRYRPGQTGVWRVGSDVAAPFRINEQGFNSGHARYALARTPGRARIAVVGDSYVAAFQVPPDRSLAEDLERDLGPERTEVYRFGVDGAPLSQYVWMLEREVLRYRPDAVVLVLIHNDFLESFLQYGGRYARSFARVALERGAVRGWSPPRRYEPTALDAVRKLATVRFFLYRQRLRTSPLALWLKRMLYGGKRRHHESNVDVEEFERRMDEIETVTDFLFARLAALSRERGFRLLIAMDGVRPPQPEGAPEPAARKLNRMAAAAARRRGIEFLDLDPVFERDWREHGRSFSFASDGHWNAYAHALVAREIARRLGG